jgi:hypothetical protein
MIFFIYAATKVRFINNNLIFRAKLSIKFLCTHIKIYESTSYEWSSVLCVWGYYNIFLLDLNQQISSIISIKYFVFFLPLSILHLLAVWLANLSKEMYTQAMIGVSGWRWRLYRRDDLQDDLSMKEKSLSWVHLSILDPVQ